MNILTDAEIMDINQNAEFDSAIGYARAIESAVLEKLKAQEPMCWMTPSGEGWMMRTEPPTIDTKLGWTALYEHPLPPDDVVLDAERYKWLRKVAPNMFWDSHDKEIGFVRFDTKAYLWKPEIFDAAIDAAMKGDAA